MTSPYLQFSGNVATMRPSAFVEQLQSIPPFNVKLNYMCGNWGNGGNANAIGVLSALRGKKPPMDVSLSDLLKPDFDLMMKGQGYYDDFVAMMSWMDRNKEYLKTIKINYSAESIKKYYADNLGYSEEKIDGLKIAASSTVKKNGQSIYDAYFEPYGGNSAKALQAMAIDKVFGIDCIGFVGQYLNHAYVIDSYPSITAEFYHNYFPKVKSIAEVAPMCILTWGNAHIAIIENVRADGDSRNSRIVDICQSSSSGPQFNRGATLKQANFGLGDRSPAIFIISGSAEVAMPVQSVKGQTLYVGKRTVGKGADAVALSYR
jgi:hypothetical protein